jgi:hypothetical protein
MLTRRKAVTAGVLAGVSATVAGAMAEAGPAPAMAEQESTASLALEREMVKMLAAIRDELAGVRRQMAAAHMPTGPGITRIRQAQRQFLKGNQKFPDFMEVGADVWDELVDWHVTTARQLAVTMRTDGRYSMPFLQTTIILRVDYGEDQVGVPFDTRPAGA